MRMNDAGNPRKHRDSCPATGLYMYTCNVSNFILLCPFWCNLINRDAYEEILC